MFNVRPDSPTARRRLCGFFSLVASTILASCVSNSGLKAISPEVGHPVYHVATVGTLQPTLRWEASSKGAAGYDLVVFEGPETFFGYVERGDRKIVYAREGIMKAEQTLEEPLQPDRFYLWSVRVHTTEGKAVWSRYSYTGFLPIPPFVY